MKSFEQRPQESDAMHAEQLNMDTKPLSEAEEGNRFALYTADAQELLEDPLLKQHAERVARQALPDREVLAEAEQIVGRNGAYDAGAFVRAVQLLREGEQTHH